MSLKEPIAVAGSFVLLRTTVSLLAVFFSCGLASAQASKQASCVVEDIDTASMPACVIQSRNGVTFVPKKYWMHTEFNRYGLSAFTIESFGRVYINRSGRVVIRDVGFVDNGPDEFHHGLVRINRDEMWVGLPASLLAANISSPHPWAFERQTPSTGSPPLPQVREFAGRGPTTTVVRASIRHARPT